MSPLPLALRSAGSAPSVLVVAPPLSTGPPPFRLVQDLLATGAEVTVAMAPEASGWHLPEPAAVLPVPLHETSAAELMAVAGAAVNAPRRFLADARRFRTTGRDWDSTWLLPFVGRRWDALYVSDHDARRWAPLFDRVAPAVVLIDRRRRDSHPTPWLRAAAEVQVISSALVDEATRGGAPPERVRVVAPRPQLPTRTRPDHSGPPTELRLACTTTLDWACGHEDLLCAVRMLVDRGIPVRLEIAGEGGARQQVQFTILDLHLADHVTFHGRLDPGGTAALLDRATTFVLAAVEDRAWPELLEAVAHGLTVVATDLPGIIAALAGAGAGAGDAILVPRRTPGDLADGLADRWARR